MNDIVVENRGMRLLTAFGILMVVAGHVDLNAFDVGELFPYYSFHVFIFLFVTGYFYKPEYESGVIPFIKKKFRNLLLPYLLWNLAYGILAELLNWVGFEFGQGLSVQTLFLAPFNTGHQYILNQAAWFVPVLFALETVYCILRVLIKKIAGKAFVEKAVYEWGLLILLLLAGGGIVSQSQRGHIWGYDLLPGRIGFMIPGIQMGRLYHRCLEERDRAGDLIYFTVLLAVQAVICQVNENISFSTAWVNGFGGSVALPYITVGTGIAFWLRISKILACSPRVAEGLMPIGRYSFAIMMHHLLGIFLLNLFFCFNPAVFPDFDRELFRKYIDCIYLPGGKETVKWIYFCMAMAVPSVIVWSGNKIRKLADSQFDNCLRMH